MKNNFRKLLFVLCILFPGAPYAKDYVEGEVVGQLGNQLFIIAATMSYAWEHDLIACFPTLFNPASKEYNTVENYKMLFFRVNSSKPLKSLKHVYQQPHFHYTPIPHYKNVKLRGYFQSEKYFVKYKQRILKLFRPTKKISDALYSKYRDIIEHPRTVSVHFRSYLHEDHTQLYNPTLPVDYFEKAIELFSEDSLFVVFSNDIQRCKKQFAHIKRNIRFIEGEHYMHDFFLMSLCKDHIISNSSFSWWAAYLNTNPDKVVVAPPIWFGPKMSKNNTKDLLPRGWLVLEY